jgi:hypothetical protein
MDEIYKAHFSTFSNVSHIYIDTKILPLSSSL